MSDSVRNPDTSALRTEGERWLVDGFDGIGDAGQVGGDKVREYRGGSFTHSFKGYEAARREFGATYAEQLAHAGEGGEERLTGMVGLVGERSTGAGQVLVCEIFDLATGGALLLRQPFKKTLLSRKRSGDIETSTTVDPLEHAERDPRTNDPRAAQVADKLKELGTALIRERSEQFSRYDLNLVVTCMESEDVPGIWHAYLRNARMKRIKGAPPMGINGAPSIAIWRDDVPINEVAFSDWLNQELSTILNNVGGRR